MKGRATHEGLSHYEKAKAGGNSIIRESPLPYAWHLMTLRDVQAASGRQNQIRMSAVCILLAAAFEPTPCEWQPFFWDREAPLLPKGYRR
jgi:hypothetical protein